MMRYTLIGGVRHDPLFAIFILQGIIATFKAYPTIADIGIFLSTISLFPEIYPCKNSIISFFYVLIRL